MATLFWDLLLVFSYWIRNSISSPTSASIDFFHSQFSLLASRTWLSVSKPAEAILSYTFSVVLGTLLMAVSSVLILLIVPSLCTIWVSISYLFIVLFTILFITYLEVKLIVIVKERVNATVKENVSVNVVVNFFRFLFFLFLFSFSLLLILTSNKNSKQNRESYYSPISLPIEKLLILYHICDFFRQLFCKIIKIFERIRLKDVIT